jgi:nucleoside-diphosphate-sugar epimerase
VAVLITGAGGYLGALVAERYRAAGEEVVSHGRAMGDLAGDDPFAGVDPGPITRIVHSGALTRFDVSRDDARAVNVEGTRKLLAFAHRCPRLQSLGHLSTVYATGLRAGPIEERLYDDGPGFANEYEWSKWEAEQLVASSDLPWRILRVATVLADDAAGHVTQHNAFHETLKLWFHGLLPLVPGDGTTPLYLVTGDFVASTVVSLMDAGAGVYHLAHAQNCTLVELLDVVAGAFAEVDSFRRRRVLPPLLGDRESFDLLASGVEAFGGGLVRQSLQSVVPFARQLFVAKEVDNARLRAALGDGYQAPDPAELVRRVCAHLVESKWGRVAVA